MLRTNIFAEKCFCRTMMFAETISLPKTIYFLIVILTKVALGRVRYGLTFNDPDVDIQQSTKDDQKNSLSKFMDRFYFFSPLEIKIFIFRSISLQSLKF